MTTLMTALFDDYTRHPIPPDVLDRWAVGYPALAAPAAELATQAATWCHPRSDAVLIPLHQLAVTGDRHAAQLILIALTPRLAAAARRQHGDRAEIAAELIGYLFEAAVTPHPGWTTRYSDQLVRAALRARQTADVTRLTIVPLVADVAQPGDPYRAVDSTSDVATFLAKHASRGTVSCTTAATLLRVAMGTEGPQPHGTAVADRARKRRQRDVHRLGELGAGARAELLAS